MGRFSPTVLPYDDGGFLGNLARALQSGTESYRVTKDRAQANEDRNRRISREDDDAAIRGITDPNASGPGYRPPTGVQGITPASSRPIGPPTDDVDPLAAAVASMPAGAAAPVSSSGVPGGFDPVTRQFAKPMAPVRLPSGRMYDPQGVMDRRLSEAMQLAEANAGHTASVRGTRMGERAQQLGALAGSPGFEDLDAGTITAASDNDALYNAIVLRDQRQRNIDPYSDEGIEAAVKRETRLGTVRTGAGDRAREESERAQEAEGMAWLRKNQGNTDIAEALAEVLKARPDLSRRLGLAGYYVRKAFAAQGQMEGVDARTEATRERTGRPDANADLLAYLRGDPAPVAGAPAPAGDPAPVRPGQIPPAPPGVDPKEWEQYLRETGQMP